MLRFYSAKNVKMIVENNYNLCEFNEALKTAFQSVPISLAFDSYFALLYGFCMLH